MKKDLLKGRYVLFEYTGNKASGWRLGKVMKVVGNTLTIEDAYKEKHRISIKTARIYGVLIKRKIRGLTKEEYTELIEWN